MWLWIGDLFLGAKNATIFIFICFKSRKYSLNRQFCKFMVRQITHQKSPTSETESETLLP
jgi:hypothetical protein